MSKKKEAGNVIGLALYWRVLAYTKPFWWALVIGLVGNACYSGVDAGMTALLKPLVDQGFIAKKALFIAWLPALIIGMVLLRSVANYFGSYFMAYVSNRVVMRFRQDIFSHFLKVPSTFYDNASSGKMLAILLFYVDQISQVSATALTRIVQAVFLIVGLLAVMLSVSWQLTALFFVLIPFMALVIKMSSRHVRKLSRALQAGMGEVTTIAEETLTGYKVVRAFGGQAYETGKFDRALMSTCRRALKLAVLKVINVSGVQMIGSVALALIVYLATAHHGTVLSAGAFVTLMAAMLGLLKPLKDLTNVNNKIQSGLAGAQGVFAFLDEQEEKDHGTRTLKRSKGLVEYRQLDFVYPGTEKQVLFDVSFTVDSGKTVALVGRSGSGKSTLANLLPRFYDCHEGAILLDGHPLQDYSLASLRDQIALVTQQVTLFNDTIARNVAYGSQQHASESAIISALKAAHAWEFIKDFPQGVETLVGENGVLLSGGQRQRLAIARAILKDAPILILDEATSSLDSESERYIQEALETLMQNRTTIVIAHRLSTIEKADNIVVMDQGRIVEQGTHEALLSNGRYYRHLHQMQFRDNDGLKDA
jgi:ATP-binding cassette, subfamily B, bacterial MsbA